MNVWMGTGRLGRDAELRYTSQGKPVCNFTMAVEKKWGKETDQKKTIWISVNLWGKLGEAISQYLRKGKKVTVKGEIDEDRWEDKDGKKRSRMLIIATEVEMHGDATPKDNTHWQEKHEDKDIDGNSVEINPAFATDDIPF